MKQSEMDRLHKFLVAENRKAKLSPAIPGKTFGVWIHPRDVPAMLSECARLGMAVDISMKPLPEEGRKYYARTRKN